jgi:hypothetical protein
METALESEPEWGTVLVCGGIRKYVLRDAESQQELALNAAEVLERFQAYRARHQPTGPDEHRLLNQSDREESGSEGHVVKKCKSGRQDSNLRHPAPKAGALARLSYAPSLFLCRHPVEAMGSRRPLLSRAIVPRVKRACHGGYSGGATPAPRFGATEMR